MWREYWKSSRFIILGMVAAFFLSGIGLYAVVDRGASPKPRVPVYVSGMAALRPGEVAKVYSPTGQYLDWGDTLILPPPGDKGRFKMDGEGIATVRYGEAYHYNPVTVAQQALAEYSRDPANPFFYKLVDRLISMQGGDGALRYDFSFGIYRTGGSLRPGWVSGMAQGQALSAYARAWHITGDEKYLDAGRAAYDFMMLPASSGGTLTDLTTLATLGVVPAEMSDFPFIMEYPQDPPVYTLNGYLFSIVGILDWAEVTKDLVIQQAAENHIATLKLLLPFFDQDLGTSYDLGHIVHEPINAGQKPNLSPKYHEIHIELLWAVNSLVPDPFLEKTAEAWRAEIQEARDQM